MAAITSGVGLISGINTGALINALVSLDSEPLLNTESEIAKFQQIQQTYSGFSTSLGQLQTIGETLAQPLTFEDATATSSDPTTLNATAAPGAAAGTYQFQVANLVSTQQTVSGGFANTNTAPVGAGTLTLEEGAGQVSTRTTLSQLNGGQGVPSGKFRITDRSGNSVIIDTSTDVTLDDVVKQINTATGISVQASINSQGLVLQDLTGAGSGNLTVTDLGGGTAAAALGIAGNSNGTDTLTGTNVNTIGNSTALSTLNDGRGVTGVSSGTDFRITASDGTTFDITLGNDATVGDVLTNIDKATGGKVTGTISTSGGGIQLTDNSHGSGSVSVSALNGSGAASELGILQSSAGGTIQGNQLIAGLDSVLVSSLNGGSGIPLGTIGITDRKGNATTVNLSGAQSLSDIINLINNAGNGVKVNASLNSAGTGIQLQDASGGTGNLVVSDITSTTAGALGIAGTFNNTQSDVGGNLQKQYISNNTLLTSLNGGAGVNLGSFTIKNSSGNTSTINLGSGTFNTVGDVITAINKTAVGVTASLNSTGNGILLTDSAGGTGALTVKDVTGTSAADLNIAGTATGTTINGAYQKTISITSTDTLSSVEQKINDLGFGVTANIINDGSSGTPFHLALTSVNSGSAGQVILDGGTTNLNLRTIVAGQDATVLFGGTGTSQPLLVTSSTNQLSNVIKGVTVSLTGVSSSPVTLTVSRDGSNVATQLGNLVSGVNALTTQIGTLTTFNTTTNQGGLLLGDSTTEQIQSTLFTAINTPVESAGPYKTLADVGITIGDNAQLSFDQNTFDAAFASNPDAVMNLFSQATTGLGNVLNNAITGLTDPVSGVLTIQNNTLTTEIQNDQQRATDLNTLLTQMRTQLQNQFNNMESTLAGLQGQQEALQTLGTISSSIGTGAATQIGSGAANDTASSTPASSNTSSTSNSTGGSIPSSSTSSSGNGSSSSSG